MTRCKCPSDLHASVPCHFAAARSSKDATVRLVMDPQPLNRPTCLLPHTAGLLPRATVCLPHAPYPQRTPPTNIPCKVVLESLSCSVILVSEKVPVFNAQLSEHRCTAAVHQLLTEPTHTRTRS